MEATVMSTEYNTKQVYFVGGGIASLAGAAFLVRDCDFPGSHIHIMEEMKILGGSNDGSGNGEQGYVIRGAACSMMRPMRTLGIC